MTSGPLQSGEINGRSVAAASMSPLDWEAIFEHPERGIIALVSRSKSADAIGKAADLIVSTLFSRAGDGDRRQAFGALLKDMAYESKTGENSFELARHRIITLLRGIKQERISRAKAADAEHAEAGGESATGSEQRRQDPEIIGDSGIAVDAPWRAFSMPSDDEDKPEDGSSKSQSPMHRQLMALPAAGSIEEAFIQVFEVSLRERFWVLQHGGQSVASVGRRPFLLSPAFVDRYLDVVRAAVMPLVVPRCRSILDAAANHAPEKWRQAFVEMFMQREERILLWEAWQSAWLATTAQSPLPPKPDVGRQTAMAKDVRPGDGSAPQSIEAWRAETDLIKRQNARSAAVWNEFTAFADDFHAPLDEDNRLLMELFGRSAGGLLEQINALLQIANNQDNASRLFETYQRGKAIDTALLAACYQYPAIFLDGSRPALGVLVRGFGRRRRLESLPLTSRYLGDRMS